MGTKEQYENMAREQLLAVMGETPETLDRVIKESVELLEFLKREEREKEKTRKLSA